MTIAKWHCSKCGKQFYTDSIQIGVTPMCHCGWENDVHLTWVNFKPDKRVFDEIKSAGYSFYGSRVTKRDAFVFSIACMTQNDEDMQDMVDKLPF